MWFVNYDYDIENRLQVISKWVRRNYFEILKNTFISKFTFTSYFLRNIWYFYFLLLLLGENFLVLLLLLLLLMCENLLLLLLLLLLTDRILVLLRLLLLSWDVEFWYFSRSGSRSSNVVRSVIASQAAVHCQETEWIVNM